MSYYLIAFFRAFVGTWMIQGCLLWAQLFICTTFQLFFMLNLLARIPPLDSCVVDCRQLRSYLSNLL